MYRNVLVFGFLFLFFGALPLSAASLFWVGGSGNWNDPSHWSATDGGAGGAGTPTATDDVFFTVNAGSGTLTLTPAATCNNMDFTGSGSLTLDAANPFTLAGTAFTFAAATAFTGTQEWIFTNGSSIAINTGTTPKTFTSPFRFSKTGGFKSIDINGTGSGTDTFNTFTINQPGSGIGNLNLRFNGTGNRFIQGIALPDTAMLPGNAVLIFGGSSSNLTTLGTGGITSKGLTRITANSNLTSNGIITVGNGVSDATRSSFTCNSDVILNENTAMGDYCSFLAQQNLTTAAGKTFSMGQLPQASFNTINSTLYSSSFGGAVSFGPAATLAPAANILFYRNTTFASTLDFGQYSRATFNVIKDTQTLFNGNVTTGFRSFIFFSDDLTFATGTTLTINDAATILASVPAPLPPITMNALFYDVVFQTSARMFFNNNFGTTQFHDITFNSFNYMEFNGIFATRITGTFTSNLDPNSCSGWNSIRSAFTGGQRSIITFDTPHDGNPGNKPVLNRVIVEDVEARYGAGAGTLGGLTILNGVDNKNNLGVTFATSRSPKTFYWVGGTVGNLKASGYINNNWSNQYNWSETDGVANTGNGCIPTPLDSVVFDALSFTDVTNRNVKIDVPVVYCKGMNWINIPPGTSALDSVFLDKDFDNNNTFSSIQVFGNLRLHPNIRNQFEGAFTFSSPVPATVQSFGVPFDGALEFDHQTGSWSILDDLNVDGSSRGDISFIRGTVNANGFTIRLEDDWTVYANNVLAGNYNGVFNPGSSGNTVIFDGPLSTSETQIIAVQQDSDPAGVDFTPFSPFFNLQIARTGGTGSITDAESVILKTPITVNNNFNITSGAFWDKGFQVTGNATGTFSLANNAHLLLGGKTPTVTLSTNVPEVTLSGVTQFPTGFINTNVNFSPTGTVWYVAHSATVTPQLIQRFSSATPSLNYGNLNISNDGPKVLAATPNTADGTINTGIQNNFYIDNGFTTSIFPALGTADTSGFSGFPDVKDLGFQFKSLNPATSLMRVGGSCILELGSLTSGTEFPAYPNDNVYIGGGSTVFYTAGVNQIVRGLDDAVDLNQTYYNVTLSNQNPTMVLKTLDRLAGFRGLLRIQSNNTLADAGYQMTTHGTASKLQMTTNGAASSALILGGLNATATGSGDFFQTGNTTIPVFNSYDLKVGNTVAYASNRTDADQPVAPLPPGNYYNLLITNWKLAGITYNGFTALIPGGLDVTTQKTMSDSISIDNTLLVDGAINGKTTTLFDNGYQIIGNAAGTLTVRERGVLKLGSGTRASVFPKNYPAASISLHPNSTVTYNANTSQTISVTPTYGNLQLDGATTPLKAKSLTGAAASVTIAGDLVINGFNNLVDAGIQLVGNATDSVRMAANGVMTLGNNTVSTTFPTNYLRNNAHLFLNSDSEVVYNGGSAVATSASPQAVAGGFSYGKLTVTNPAANATAGGTKAYKRLETANSGVTDLTVNTDNELQDNGFQLTGLPGRRIYLAGDTRLVLGTDAIATQFPQGYTYSTSDIVLDPQFGTGEVVYNAGINQTLKGLPGTNADNFTYVNLTLNNNTGTLRTKTLDRSTNVRQNLTINNANTLDVSASDFDIYLQGNWVGNAGSNLTPRNGRVYFNNKSGTTGIVQTILTNNTAANHQFKNLTFDLSLPSDVQLLDDVTLTGNTDFVLGDVITGVGSKRLIFTDGATATNASDNSHAKFGQVKKVGNQAFVFPLGNGTYYRYIGMSAPAANTAEFTARYIDKNPTLDGFDYTIVQTTTQNLSLPLAKASRAEYWTLDRGATTSDNVNVTLSWGANSGGIADLSKLRVARWNGSLWQNHNSVSPVITGDVNKGDILSDLRTDGLTGGVNQFSPFTLASTDIVNPLPVTLLSFMAEAQPTKIKLTWQTTFEKNTGVFTAERSKDGNTFEPVVSVDAKGNPATRNDYTAFDEKPFFGISYYRLKITDHDGTFAYSKTLSVLFNGKADEVVLYPNPSDGSQFYIRSSTAWQVQGLYDMTGRPLNNFVSADGQTENGMKFTLNKTLPSGIYMLVLVSPAGGDSRRIAFTVR